MEQVTVIWKGVSHNLRPSQVNLDNICLLCGLPKGTRVFLRDELSNVVFDNGGIFSCLRNDALYEILTNPMTSSSVKKVGLCLHFSCLGDLSANFPVWSDLSGNGNDAILSGAARFINNNIFDTSREKGQASVKCSNTICGLNNYTLEAWVCPTAWNDTLGYGGMILSLVGQYYLEVTSKGKVSVYCYGLSQPGYHDSISVLPLGCPSHIVCSYTSSAFNIFINGKPDCSFPATGTPKDDRSYRLVLGSWGNSCESYCFTGQIFVARIYNVALSQSEISQNYEAEKTQIENIAQSIK